MVHIIKNDVMKHHHIILILTLLFCSLHSAGQNELKYAPSTRFINNKSDAYLISTRPVTNREYIIYLLWICNTQMTDYPEVFYNAIPGQLQKDSANKSYEYYDTSNVFKTIFKISQPFVKNYMFNPKYIDYPVIGISWLQANRYCKWLADRYNEFKMIQRGFLLPDMNQQNEECFVTESFLADQYVGMRVKGKENATIKWSAGLLIPSFRLPTAKEIDFARNLKIIQTDFMSYKFENDNFLSQWADWGLTATETKLILRCSYNSKATIEIDVPKEDWDMKKYKYEELSFDINFQNNNPGINEIYEKHNQKLIKVKDMADLEKDSLGQMPYIIIGENEKKEPIAVGRFNRTDMTLTDVSKLYYFRYSVAMKPKEYKQ